MDLDLDGLATLEAAVRLGTLDAAARELGVTPSAVSQRLKALESRSGQVLARRTRPITPTDAGRELVRIAAQVQILADEARGVVSGLAGRTAVAVAVNADSLATWFLPVVGAAMEQGVAIEVIRDDEGSSADLLRAGRVVGAVTSQPVSLQGCRAEPLGRLRYVAVAAPALVERYRGSDRCAWDLARAPLIAFDRQDGHQHVVRRRHLADPEVTAPTVYVPSTRDHGRAVRAGIGWAVLPEVDVVDDLRSGSLLPLTPDGSARLDVALWWQCWRLRAAVTETLTDLVRRYAGRALEVGPPRDGAAVQV